MKKKIWIPIIVILILILFLPIPSGVYLDGGTRTYTALTYKIVNWNRLDGYDETKVYFFPDNFKSLDELWALESGNGDGDVVTERVRITKIYGDTVYIEKEDDPNNSITFSKTHLENIDAHAGDFVNITYNGLAAETYPLQISVTKWTKESGNYVPLDYYKWMDTDPSALVDHYHWGYIKEAGADYVIVRYFHYKEQEAYYIRLNGAVDDYCIDDAIEFDFKDAYIDKVHKCIVAQAEGIRGAIVCAKPVIYLYPEKKTDVTVTLDLDGRLTCTYPAYDSGWTVTASPDGTLTDKNGQTYNYLYWEGETSVQYDMSSGFCVKGEDTAQFLETALAALGLSRREANEFIVYWLPLMECNPYNVISFQTDVYTDSAKLEINPAPDTLIRVFMAWQSCDEFVELVPQTLTAPERVGFTVVEWGGSEIKK